MDVRCSTCGEPWDTYHLWQDAIFDTGLTIEEAEAWLQLPGEQRLSERYRAEFRAALWEFGQSVINVTHCPCCPPDAQPNPDRVATKAALERLMAGDEDGLAATYEDYRL